ncbi:MAG TPA: outer membrane protein assembly factor BamD [Candidatus Cloacimonetes bacterium]|nr:outer membrane protein assembly factor BamD [Candidatus Cloacimonadota bacterium]
MKKIVFPLIFLILLLGACSSNKAFDAMPVAEKMRIGNELFGRKKYNKAIPYYTAVAFEKNSAYTAEAQARIADCYFNQNKFIDAIFEYEELIRIFPDYEDINLAYFQIGVCHFERSLSPHYSQEETNSAIASFERFIEKFPFDHKKSEAIEYINKCHYKLLEKKYYNGYAYYKMYDYSAALMYFDEIIELGNINELDKKSLYYAARIYIVRKDKDNALKMSEKINARYPDSKEAHKINKLVEKKF